MANDIMDALKGVLGNDAEEKIQGAFKSLSEATNEGENIDFSNQLKNLMGQMSQSNDTRSNLLMSLKPFMRNERRKSIDNLVKVLNITRFSNIFK